VVGDDGKIIRKEEKLRADPIFMIAIWDQLH
jgi:hypothetical protein